MLWEISQRKTNDTLSLLCRIWKQNQKKTQTHRHKEQSCQREGGGGPKGPRGPEGKLPSYRGSHGAFPVKHQPSLQNASKCVTPVARCAVLRVVTISTCKSASSMVGFPWRHRACAMKACKSSRQRVSTCMEREPASALGEHRHRTARAHTHMCTHTQQQRAHTHRAACAHVQMHTHTRAYTLRAAKHTHQCVHIYTHTRMHAQGSKSACTYTQTHTRMHTQGSNVQRTMCTCVHVLRAHTCTHTNTHTCMCTHTMCAYSGQQRAVHAHVLTHNTHTCGACTCTHTHNTHTCIHAQGKCTHR